MFAALIIELIIDHLILFQIYKMNRLKIKKDNKKRLEINSNLHGGEGGIRTHVGLHPNGFQDRPVMTTSVPLQKLVTHARFERATP